MRYLFLVFLLTFSFSKPVLADCSGPNAQAGTMEYFGSPENTFKFCNGSQWIGMAGGVSGGGLKFCKENEHCFGTPVLCGSSAPDFKGVMDIAQAGTITFGSWNNVQCGMSGTGWHAGNVSSCSTGMGTKKGRCLWVLVDTGSGGDGGQ